MYTSINNECKLQRPVPKQRQKRNQDGAGARVTSVRFLHSS